MIEKERGNNNMDAVDIILKVIGWVVSPILSFTVGLLVSTQRNDILSLPDSDPYHQNHIV